MAFNNAKNIIVGAAPVFISTKDSTDSTYAADFENLLDAGHVTLASGTSAQTTLAASAKVRNVGFTNNGLQITYNPTFEDVTVDQLLDAAKLFKSAMQVMIMTEMTEGTLQNVLTIFGQKGSTLTKNSAASTDNYAGPSGAAGDLTLGLEAGALGAAPTERQLFAVGQAPTFKTVSGTESSANSERVYYARRVLSVQQTQFTLARNTPTTFPVTFRLLPDANYVGAEYGKIIDRIIA
jgi:hypothetical protein